MKQRYIKFLFRIKIKIYFYVNYRFIYKYYDNNSIKQLFLLTLISLFTTFVGK